LCVVGVFKFLLGWRTFDLRIKEKDVKMRREETPYYYTATHVK
jgi:hypothetical protein